MKQAAHDGATLQGDTTYWKNGTVLNDTVVGRSMGDGNFVSAAFAALPAAEFRLQAANETTMRYQSNEAPMTAYARFGDARVQRYSDTAGTWAPSAPNWFVRSTVYPSGLQLRTARFGMNFVEVYLPTNTVECGVRWGWAGNENLENDSAGSHDACGGLGGYGTHYGAGHMNSNKGAWQPATLYLWGK